MKHQILELEDMPKGRNEFQDMLNKARYAAKAKRRKRMQLIALTIFMVLLVLLPLPSGIYQFIALAAAIVFLVSVIRIVIRRRQFATS